MKNRLPEPIVVKLIRVVPVLEVDFPISLRIEVYGCGEGETTPLPSTEGTETTAVPAISTTSTGVSITTLGKFY